MYLLLLQLDQFNTSVRRSDWSLSYLSNIFGHISPAITLLKHENIVRDMNVRDINSSLTLITVLWLFFSTRFDKTVFAWCWLGWSRLPGYRHAPWYIWRAPVCCTVSEWSQCRWSYHSNHTSGIYWLDPLMSYWLFSNFDRHT